MNLTSCSEHQSRRRPGTVARGLAVASLTVVLVAGCGRLHRDAGSASPAADRSTTTTAVPDGSSPATNPPTAPTSGSATDAAQLDQISTELGTVDAELSGAGSDVDAATAALNSQEGDPSK